MDTDVSALVARVRRAQNQRAVVEALLSDVRDPLLLLIHVWLICDDDWIKMTVDSHDGREMRAHIAGLAAGKTATAVHMCFLGHEITRDLPYTVVTNGGDVILALPWRFT